MIIDRMFEQNDIIGAGLQAAVVRNDVIANNIANADVPGFKKSTVRFESYLANAVADYKKTGKLNLKNALPTIHLDNNNYSYRIDGNNVDYQAEMVDLYDNSVKYDVMISGILNNYKRINLVTTIK